MNTEGLDLFLIPISNCNLRHLSNSGYLALCSFLITQQRGCIESGRGKASRRFPGEQSLLSRDIDDFSCFYFDLFADPEFGSKSWQILFRINGFHFESEFLCEIAIGTANFFIRDTGYLSYFIETPWNVFQAARCIESGRRDAFDRAPPDEVLAERTPIGDARNFSNRAWDAQRARHSVHF